jgi:tetratricopeptide (TPR) repeat protein
MTPADFPKKETPETVRNRQPKRLATTTLLVGLLLATPATGVWADDTAPATELEEVVPPADAVVSEEEKAEGIGEPVGEQFEPLINPAISEHYLHDDAVLRQMLGITVFDDEEEAPALLDAVGREAKAAYVEGALGEQVGFRSQGYRALMKAAEADPENAWIANRAARSAIQQNDIAGAEKLAKRILESDPKNTNAMAVMATLGIVRNNIAEARTWYERMLEIQPRNLQALTSLARISHEIDNDPEKTKEYASRILKITSRSLEAILWHAEASARTGEIDVAADLYAQLIRYRPMMIARLVEMGESLMAQGRRSDARELYRRGVVMMPQSEVVRLRWETILEEDGGAELIRSEYEALLEKNPLDLSLHELYAEYLARTDQRVALLSQRRRMLEINPAHIPSLLSMGRLHIDLNQVEMATQFFEQAIAAGPEQASVFREIGMVYLVQDDAERAEELLNQALLLDPNDADTVVALAALAEQRGDKGDAERKLKRAIDIAPGNDRLLRILGDFYRREGRLDESSQLYQQVLAVTPSDLNAQIILALLWMELGRDNSLDQLQQRAPLTVRNRPAFYAAYGDLAREYGMWPRARWAYEKGLEQDPTSLPLVLGLARVFLHLGDQDAALQQISDARERVKGNAEQEGALQGVEVQLLMDMGKPELVVPILRAMLEGNEKDFGLRSTLLETLAMTDMESETTEELNQFVRDFAVEKPHETQLLRARVLRTRGDNQRSLGILRPMAQEFPEDTRVQFELAVTLGELKQVSEASRAYRRVMELAEKDEESAGYLVNAYNNLAYLYATSATNLEEAETLARKAMELRPRTDYILDTLGWVLYQQKRYEEAEKLLKDAERLSLGDPEIHENLGDLLRDTGRPEEALQQYQQALKHSSHKPERLEQVQRKIEELGGVTEQAVRPE